SSRRRHTSFSRDWSSDVCSADLTRSAHLQPRRLPWAVGQGDAEVEGVLIAFSDGRRAARVAQERGTGVIVHDLLAENGKNPVLRSEERGGGKEAGAGGRQSPDTR